MPNLQVNFGLSHFLTECLLATVVNSLNEVTGVRSSTETNIRLNQSVVQFFSLLCSRFPSMILSLTQGSWRWKHPSILQCYLRLHQSHHPLLHGPSKFSAQCSLALSLHLVFSVLSVQLFFGPCLLHCRCSIC